MISIRQLLIIGLIAAGLWFFKRVSAQVKDTLAHKSESKPKEKPVVETVRCEQCGLHLPAQNAIKANAADQYYCSREHKTAHEKEFQRS